MARKDAKIIENYIWSVALHTLKQWNDRVNSHVNWKTRQTTRWARGTLILSLAARQDCSQLSLERENLDLCPDFPLFCSARSRSVSGVSSAKITRLVAGPLGTHWASLHHQDLEQEWGCKSSESERARRFMSLVCPPFPLSSVRGRFLGTGPDTLEWRSTPIARPMKLRSKVEPREPWPRWSV